MFKLVEYSACIYGMPEVWVSIVKPGEKIEDGGVILSEHETLEAVEEAYNDWY
jgi:hypothetical protein